MYRTHSGRELQEFAARYVGSLERLSGATVVTLSGELGAGKTTFTQGLAEALGVKETVSSPTYVIEKAYELNGQPWKRLIHIDAYRLNGPHELSALGWEELVADPGNLIVLEWPERIEGALPEGVKHLRFEIEGDGRIITINGGEEGDKEKNAKES